MERLRRRGDFLAAASSSRAATRTFTLQARRRGETDDAPPRVGLTASKRTGTAVERNRIKRRLRALVRHHGAMAMRPGFDYVLVARREVLGLSFEELAADLMRALARVHGAGTGKQRNSEMPGS